ncbi:MAG: zf-HC2 domain-containing protein, partial [Gemmatimonadaceae bacterium]
MSDIRLNFADVDFAQDAETREARHEMLASFLGAYADGELPPETQSHIDAHLDGCPRCCRELDIHRAVRERLGNEPVPAASAALRTRIAIGIKKAPPPLFARPVEPAFEQPTRAPRTV